MYFYELPLALVPFLVIYHLANINKLIADYVGVLRTGGAAERALAALAADAAARLSGTMASPWGGAPRKVPPLLCAAAEMGRVDVVKVLLKAAEGGQAAATVKGAIYVNEADADGATPLFMAAHQGHVDALKALLVAGADVNQAMTDGATPLFIASEVGNLEAVGILLSAGADKGASTNEAYTAVPPGTTALAVAELNGHSAVAALLR